MKLQLSEQEQQVLQSLTESTEGEVLVRLCRRLVSELTNTRTLKGDDIPTQVAAANMASAIIEENLIEPLSRTRTERGEPDRLD